VTAKWRPIAGPSTLRDHSGLTLIAVTRGQSVIDVGFGEQLS